MHKNWIVKRYDQSVACLADNPHNLGIRLETLFPFNQIKQVFGTVKIALDPE